MSLMKQKAQQNTNNKKDDRRNNDNYKRKTDFNQHMAFKVCLIINDFDYSVKGHRLAELIKKNFQNVRWW